MLLPFYEYLCVYRYVCSSTRIFFSLPFLCLLLLFSFLCIIKSTDPPEGSFLFLFVFFFFQQKSQHVHETKGSEPSPSPEVGVVVVQSATKSSILPVPPPLPSLSGRKRRAQTAVEMVPTSWLKCNLISSFSFWVCARVCVCCVLMSFWTKEQKEKKKIRSFFSIYKHKRLLLFPPFFGTHPVPS